MSQLRHRCVSLSESSYNKGMKEEQITTVFTRLKSVLKARASRVLMSEDDADDALQEAFCRLWSNRTKYSSESEVEGVAKVTVRNICIDAVRRESTHPQSSIDDTQAASIVEDNDSSERTEIYNDVTRLIDGSLSERDRRVLYMRDRDGWEFEDIAVATGLSEANVRVIVSRARKAIRTLYRNRNKTEHNI